MATRRQTLRVLGGGAALLAASGGWWAATREPEAARAPWAAAGAADGDARRRALSWAILAPSAHNRQPWAVDLSEPEIATLYCDLDRRLPHTDPVDRQIAISLGCFLELLVMAAAADGRATDIALFPDGAPPSDGRLDERPVARLRFRDGAIADSLFAWARDRRSVKAPFTPGRPPDDAAMATLAAAPRVAHFGATRAPDRVAAINALAADAWTVEAQTPAAHGESVDLMRLGKREIEASPDGIDLGGAFLESLHLVGALTREALRDPASQNFAQGRLRYMAMLDANPAWVWLSTDGDGRAAQIDAGRDWMRLHLAAVGAGLAVHPMSQALQEYPEMRAVAARVGETLGAGGRVQMLARVGYAAATPPSPRWPYETRILPA